MLYSKSGNPSISLVEGHQTQVTDLAPVVPYSTVLPFTSTALLTKTTQVAWVPINPSDVNYFSTHIKYDLDGNTIVYNSDIIWKANYWNNAWISSNFAGIKVSGVSTSSNTGEVVANQFANDITVLGSINRASLKKDIISKAYSFINQVTPNNGVDTNYQITDLQDFSVNSDGVKLQWGNVLYFGGLNGEVVTLGDIFGANQGELVTGKKTIVIVWGNLYIKSNMYYGNKNSDILWIIVLESPTDPTKWGNVYIDPSVTNVVGNVFADKSLISFNGVAELDGGATFDELKNQLHIYGSVYSENTIGGSRTTPVKCPYYVDSSVCSTSDQAQKYDLNFLRRYFIWWSGAPSKNGKVIGWGTCVWTSCSGGNASFARNIITTTDKYGKYPVVIEYQPLLSTTPPPLFNK